MTRDDIVKTLECCTINASCADCPLFDDNDCHNTILKECLYYITEESSPKIKFDFSGLRVFSSSIDELARKSTWLRGDGV